MPFLVYVSLKRGIQKKGHGHCAFLSRITIPKQVYIGKFIYNASTLHSKQLLLQHDHSQGHKSAVYHQKCLPGNDILLKLPSYSWKRLLHGINRYKAYKWLCIGKPKFSWLASYITIIQNSNCRIAQNSGRGKLWWIWWNGCHLPILYPTKFQILQMLKLL